MKKLTLTVQAIRAVRALLLVGLGLGVVGLTGLIDDSAKVAAGEGKPTFSGREVVRQIGEADDGLNGLVSAAGEMPPWFSEEVCDVADKSDVRATEDWAVVSWTEPMDGVKTLEAMVAILGGHGWTVLDSGVDQVVTCVKEGGRCQWLWLSCTEVAGETSVVVQVASAALP